MREIRGGVFQGRFHNLLISKNNTFWAPQISRITFQVVLDTLATDKICEGPASPSLCASLVMGEPPFAHPEGCFALLRSALASHLRCAIRQQLDVARQHGPASV